MRFLSVCAAAGILAAALMRAEAADAVLPVDPVLCAEMKSTHVLNAGAPVGCDRLRLVEFDYVDFQGNRHTDGRLVVMDAVADRVLRIFEALRARRFPIAKAKLMDAYEGNDEASMADDNTSAFNDRDVPGSPRKSLHAYGVAIDLNPVENPFVTHKDAVFTLDPPGSAGNFNRLIHRPGKPERRGFAEEVVTIFAANGFADWGGYWDDPVDWQHFDIGRALADELAGLPPEEAKKRFEASITH